MVIACISQDIFHRLSGNKKSKNMHISYMLNKITLTIEKSTELHNLFLLKRYVYVQWISKNDTFKTTSPSVAFMEDVHLPHILFYQTLKISKISIILVKDDHSVKYEPHKMVKHTQTICFKCAWPFGGVGA